MAARHQPLRMQVPQLISYQAVARDLTGKVPSEKTHLRASGNLAGQQPRHGGLHRNPRTNHHQDGNDQPADGGGNVQAGAFAEIDWSKAPYFLRLGMKQKVETK